MPKSIKIHTSELAGRKTYTSIIQAFRSGKLKEPITSYNLHKVCPEIKMSTCSTFLSKHRKGNPSKTSELFIEISRGKYVLIRPFKYSL